jgi:ABC-type glycerol-3-phosphate transport system substrate-binding protein
MSSRKIIFLIVVSIVWLLMVYGIWNLSQTAKIKKDTKVKNITLWVVWDTSQQYQDLLSEFWKANPTYKDTTIDVRVFPDYEKYQRILLSTLSEWTGPDIFMVEWGGDAILESKILPLPDSVIWLSNFDKKYEDIFLPLIVTEGKWEKMKRSLLGIPLGYEALWVFYHKSLLRSVPKTWSEVQSLDLRSDTSLSFATNLGLGPIYTPYATDIIAYFIGKDWVTRSTESIQNGIKGIDEYLAYADAVPSQASEWSDASRMPLREMRKNMDEWLLSTIDLFMRGRIAMVIGYPSLIREIEKAWKRAWDELLDDLILTERLPQDSLGKNKINIARYRFLALSKKTENPLAWADLLSYIMSDAGMSKSLESFPLLISPLRATVESQRETSLSKVFARTRLDAFIPELWDDIFLYDYRIKWEYEKTFREYLDRNTKIDINNMVKVLSKNISCELESTLSWVVSESCVSEVIQ